LGEALAEGLVLVEDLAWLKSPALEEAVQPLELAADVY